jgi:putative transposase
LLWATTLAGKSKAADLFLTVLEEVRQRYGFVVAGYVVMPEHIHLLISETKVAHLSGHSSIVDRLFTPP